MSEVSPSELATGRTEIADSNEEMYTCKLTDYRENMAYTHGWNCENIETCGNDNLSAGSVRWFCEASGKDYCRQCGCPPASIATAKSVYTSPYTRSYNCIYPTLCACGNSVPFWVMAVLLISVVSCKWAYDATYDRFANCSAWDGGGSCEECSTFLGPWLAKQDMRAMCSKCRPGLVLVSGPPVKRVFKSPDGDPFLWETHCAEPNPEEERHVLMILHGQSTWNKRTNEMVYAGLSFGLLTGDDSPLSELGVQQAQRLARILKKANAELYGSDLEPTVESRSKYDYSELSAARSDLEKARLEKVVITYEPTQKSTTDHDCVQNLIDDRNRVELEVLLGRKCEETNFVSSPLVRAMDTLVIGTLERNMKCPTPFQISSNLQEIKHSMDSAPNLQPGHVPVIVDWQRAQYEHADTHSTLAYVEAAYKESNTSRHDSIKTSVERAGLFDQVPEMQAELDATFSSPRKFSVWSGHSIWFREFFEHFADMKNNDCKALANKVLAYTAVLSVKLRTLSNSPKKYVAYDCRFIYLGLEEEFKHSEKADPNVNIASEL